MLEQLQSKAADVRQVRAVFGSFVLGARCMEGDRCLTCRCIANHCGSGRHWGRNVLE